MIATLGLAAILTVGAGAGCLKEAGWVAQPAAGTAWLLAYWARGCQEWDPPIVRIQRVGGATEVVDVDRTHRVARRREGLWSFSLPAIEEGDILTVIHHGQWLSGICGRADGRYTPCYASWLRGQRGEGGE